MHSRVYNEQCEIGIVLSLFLLLLPVHYLALIFQANLDKRITRKCIQSPPRLSNVLPSRLPLAQILLQQIQDPNVHCLLTFSKKALCLIFF